jgi:urease accessory protein
MAGGDELHVSCSVEAGAHCLITSPSAEKIYRTDARGVPQSRYWISEQEDGILEYLPQETLVFNGANARLFSDFRLKGRSRLIAWDILCLGRPTGGERFVEGRLVRRTRVVRDGLPLLHERTDMEGGDAWSASPAGLRGHTVSASFFACGRKDNAADEAALRTACLRLQELAASGLKGRAGAAFRGGALLARLLGEDGAEAKAFCLDAWNITRPLLLGREAHEPRIWNC